MKFNLRKKSYYLSESAESADIPEAKFFKKEEFKKNIHERLPEVGGDFSELSKYIREMSSNREFITFLYLSYEHMIIEITNSYGREYADGFRDAMIGAGIKFND